jgi:hydroxylamine reductase
MGDADCFSLNEIATYGTKGVCAYATHCYQLGSMDEDVMVGIHEVLAKLASDEADMEGLLANVLKVGEISTKVLGMLDSAHADTLGAPEITQVCTTAVQGKAILVSGHDMLDLLKLLEQTKGMGINVYTHGEMLPAHSYPELKKFKHLVGNYGTAWQNQKFEFAAFPGPIVMTTNCIIEPRRIYKNRIWTMNEVGYDGVQHIGPGRDFSQVIAQAQKEKGFKKTVDPAQYMTIGFNHRVVVPLADKVIEAAKSGDLSRIFLIGGCDGSQWERSYFTDLAEETPDDSLILTMGCAKNRLIHSEKLEGATLANGLPRVLDMGQCNDSYSAVVVATELAKALDCTVNDLPLSLAVSHLEQKAAAVLLCLLHLGVKNIRLGPSLPAYITPNVLEVLVKNYNIMPTGDVKEDLKMMMEGK